MYHTEQQQKKEAVDGAENCVNRMSADEVEAAIKKRFSGTGPSARSITRYVNEYKLVGVSRMMNTTIRSRLPMTMQCMH